jgi:type IV secretory pathway VirB2 component (pilin)
MQDMMSGMGGMMMWSMGLLWFLLVVVLVLAAAALIKYLFSKQR